MQSLWCSWAPFGPYLMPYQLILSRLFSLSTICLCYKKTVDADIFKAVSHLFMKKERQEVFRLQASKFLLVIDLCMIAILLLIVPTQL